MVLMGEGRQAGFILCGLGSPVRCLVVAFLFSQLLLLFPEGLWWWYGVGNLGDGDRCSLTAIRGFDWEVLGAGEVGGGTCEQGEGVARPAFQAAWEGGQRDGAMPKRGAIRVAGWGYRSFQDKACGARDAGDVANPVDCCPGDLPKLLEEESWVGCMEGEMEEG